MRAYNTALAGGNLMVRAGLGETDFATSSRGTVFAHDMCEPLPPRCDALIDRAKCFMADIAWVDGWPMFHHRAGLEPGNWIDYLYNIKALIDFYGKPAFIVGGTRSANLWNPPLRRRILLNGSPAVLAVFHTDRLPEARTAPEALAAEIAAIYPSVYDFSCGYGNYLRPFRYFVGSDIDKKCLDYVARELL